MCLRATSASQAHFRFPSNSRTSHHATAAHDGRDATRCNRALVHRRAARRRADAVRLQMTMPESRQREPGPLAVSRAPATMEVKVWGMESLRALFGRFDLTEEQFLAALDSDELGDMVGSIADD